MTSRGAKSNPPAPMYPATDACRVLATATLAALKAASSIFLLALNLLFF